MQQISLFMIQGSERMALLRECLTNLVEKALTLLRVKGLWMYLVECIQRPPKKYLRVIVATDKSIHSQESPPPYQEL